MRCFSCERLSIDVICKRCRLELFRSQISRRKVGTLEVVSLFSYESIEPFLLTKHKVEGWRIYRWFGKHFVKPFLQAYAHQSKAPFTIIGVDERVKDEYSHIAALMHGAKDRSYRIKHARLLAKSDVNYSGKTLGFRLTHPRAFIYKPVGGDIVLVDDIVTTGLTLQEASVVIEQAGDNLLFALTLSDAKLAR